MDKNTCEELAQKRLGEEWQRGFYEGLEAAAKWCDDIKQKLEITSGYIGDPELTTEPLASEISIASGCASTIRKKIRGEING